MGGMDNGYWDDPCHPAASALMSGVEKRPAKTCQTRERHLFFDFFLILQKKGKKICLLFVSVCLCERAGVKMMLMMMMMTTTTTMMVIMIIKAARGYWPWRVPRRRVSEGRDPEVWSSAVEFEREWSLKERVEFETESGIILAAQQHLPFLKKKNSRNFLMSMAGKNMSNARTTPG
jgi:hypothetical protein